MYMLIRKIYRLTTTFINLTFTHCNEPELNLWQPEIINKLIGKNVYNFTKCLKHFRIHFKAIKNASLSAT